MKYLLKTFLFLLVLLIILKFTIHKLNSGHEITYTRGNFNITENYYAKEDNYMFNLKKDKLNLKFDIIADYNKKKNIITKVYYKKIDNYDCVLPVFDKNKFFTDIMCKKDNTVYYAYQINNKNIEKFAKTMEKNGYKMDRYKDKTEKHNLSETNYIYKENVIDNHYLALENYKGIELYNSKKSEIKLFENDVYKKNISLFFDKYYLVADYNNQYTFKIFKVINIINGTEKEVRSYDEISFDSIIQGVVNNEVYIFDKDSKKQYKINIEKETVEKVGEGNNIKYYNGKWGIMKLSEALNDKVFNNYQTNIYTVEKADKIGGYYYLYEKTKNGYSVYKTYDKKVSQKIYLFETDDVNSIIYLNNYIYFKKGNIFYYYSKDGIKKVLESEELKFNNDISLGVYIN